MTPSRTRALLIGLLAALALLWVVGLTAVFYPGESSPDTVKQYKEAQAWSFTNTHPPLHTALLGLSVHGTGGPGGMLWAQLLTFAAAAAWLTGRAVDKAATRGGQALAVGLLVLCLLLPCCWSVATALWKDIWTANFLLLAAAGLTLSSRASVAVVVAAGIGLCATRHNAVLLAVPLAAFAAGRLPGPGLRRIVAAGAAAAAVVVVPLVTERALPVRDAWPFGPIVVYDSAGLIGAHPEEWAASPLAPVATAEALRKAWRPEHGWRVFGGKGIPGLKVDDLQPHREAYTDAWLGLIQRHPRTWLEHRAATFGHQLGLREVPRSAWADSRWKGVPKPQLKSASYLHLDGLRTSAATSTPLYRPWPWCLLLLTIFGAALWRRRLDVAVVAAAVLGYFGAYFFVAASAEFRYAHPVVIACFACGWLWLAVPRPPSKPV